MLASSRNSLGGKGQLTSIVNINFKITLRLGRYYVVCVQTPASPQDGGGGGGSVLLASGGQTHVAR